MSPLVDISDVSLVYGGGNGGTLAVEKLNMRVREGEFVAVVGPSGCGKSSLMKLVTGLAAPTSGGIIVNGRELDGPTTIVGMAFQNPNLLPWRTTLDNVLLPLEVTKPARYEFRKRKAEYVERAMDLLRTVGLEDFAGHYPWQLSGGMQQRASLCRALVHEPRLLMLDEPFGALDAFTREELWDVLQDIWMKRGFTVILVTHDLREALYLADTVQVMSNRPGRIVQTVETSDFARPRDNATFLQPGFNEQVLALREQIRNQRVPVGAATKGEVWA